MSTDDTSGKRPGPGFLGDDDLLAELDAWDKTFDALHTEGPPEAEPAKPAAKTPPPIAPIPAPPPRGGKRPSRPPPPPPGSRGSAPSLPTPTSVSVPPRIAPIPAAAKDRTEVRRTPVPPPPPDDLDNEPSDGGGTLDRESTLDRGQPDALGDLAIGDETDFSELAPGASPEALGAMLGTPSAPPIRGDEDAATSLRLGAAPIEDPFDEDVFAQDDNVYTSASRPLPAPPLPGGDPDFDEGDARPAAPPPRRSRRTTPYGGEGGGAFDAPTRLTTLDEQLLKSSRRDPAVPRSDPTPPRTGPAVVRRDRGKDDRATPAGGIPYITDDGATKIANVHEMEAQAQASAQQFFADLDDDPKVSLEVDESAYDDIELDQGHIPTLESDVSAQTAASLDSPGLRPGLAQDARALPVERKTTAHVVRRTLPPTKPPPVSEQAQVIELEADDAGPIGPTGQRVSARMPSTGAEDDFSDVGAEVEAASPLPTLIEPEPHAFALDDIAPTDENELLPARTAAADPSAITKRGRHSEPPPPPRGRRGSAPDAERLPAVPQVGADNLARTFADVPAPSDDIVSARVNMPTSVPPLGAPVSPSRGVVSARVKTPTSVPPLGGATATPHMTLVGMAPPAAPSPAPPRPAFEGPEPGLELDYIHLPEQVDPEIAGPDDSAAAQLLIYERELDTTDDSAAAAALRVESGRLCERLGNPERARVHYEAALIADPRSTAALRGLRRLARAAADLGEATRHLDSELTIASERERRPLALHRVDLLMASGEQDLARVAVGELLDENPLDVRALLAHLELAFLDGRADEFGESLNRLGDAIADPGLRAVAMVARGHLGERTGDRPGAHAAFAAGLAADPGAEGAAIGTARVAAMRGDQPAAGTALGVLAARLVETSPATAAAMALRASIKLADPTVRAQAIATALAAAPSSPVVAVAAADAATATSAAVGAGADADVSRAGAFRHLASTEARPGVRGFAAAMAAELTPALVDSLALWQLAVAADPDDDYAVAQLRAAHIAGDNTGAALELDRGLVGSDPSRERVVVRAAYGLAARGDVAPALALIDATGATASKSTALIDARADILAAAGRWEDRAKALSAVAAGAGDSLDRTLFLVRAARAWDDAAAAALDPDTGDGSAESTTRTAVAALDAWSKVLDDDAGDGEAHGAAVTLAERVGDRDILFDALTRAQAAEKSPARALALALRRARVATAGNDHGRAEEVLREAAQIGATLSSSYGAGDPRRLAAVIALAAKTGRIAEAATALEERAELAADTGRKAEAAALRYRAAQLWLSPVDDPARAAAVLAPAVADFPHLAAAQDLLATARRRSGDAMLPPTPVKRDAEAGKDAFARLVREAEIAAERGDAGAATLMLGRALELRPGDPLAQEPLVRFARQSGQPGPISQVALSGLRVAEELGDAVARADAYEQLARIDADLRGDPGSALISWQAALEADPKRYAVLRQLERAYLSAERWSDLAQLRELELALVDGGSKPAGSGSEASDGVPSAEPAADGSAPAPSPSPSPAVRADAVGIALDRALLGERAGLDDDALRAMFRRVVELDPASRLGLFHLESIVRRQGSTPELATLEEKIADWFEDDADAQAAFLTRAGETLTDLGKLDEAISRFKRAVERVSGHAPALQGWRAAALKGELWIDVADAAMREADIAIDDPTRAQLFHLAGVALMDRALIGERAMIALQKTLIADPRHQDAFVRLRILLEEDANHDDLASLLSQRLDVETDARHRIELHRAVAELHRNFLDDRDTAKRHYRAILEADPNDLRAIAAVSDICFEQGQWAEAAEALMARAKLEQDPQVLKNLFFRLGLIYADRIPDAPVAIKAFQRVLTYAPDDENALDRLADLAMQTGEWKMALGACERLVKGETDPERRVRHLHRVAKIFADGMEDRKRAERALNLALDGAPASEVALGELIRFYQDAGDTSSTRVHLNRVAGAMRARIAENPRDGVAARVLSRAMVARHKAGVHGSRSLARAGAELALLVGGGTDAERNLLAEPTGRLDLVGLMRPEADEILFPATVPAELRQLLSLVGDRIAKHVGVDLRPYGVSRGDRLRAKDSLIAAAAQDLAGGLGLGEIDCYLSSRQPWAMVAEPTSPVSLVLGAELARGEVDDVRFAAGGALKLAQSAMAIPFRLAPDELGALVIGLIRLFQPDFPALFLEPEVVIAQSQKLKRLIPSGLMNELRPFALAIDGNTFDHRAMAAGVRAAAYRAGLITGGSLAAAIRVLAGRSNADPHSILDNPEVRDLIGFALGEDHAALAG